MISDIKLGYGIALPYFIAPNSHSDFTITAAALTNQGIIMGGEYRKRLENGGLSIRGSGINQLNPDEFAGTVGERQYRGAV